MSWDRGEQCMKSEPIRIVIVDDHPLFRDGVAQAITTDKRFKLVGTGGTGADALRLVRDMQPNIVLLDLNMPGGGVDLVAQLSRTSPETKVVMLTVSEEEEHVTEALNYGGRGYILKGVGGIELMTTLVNIHEGESFVTPKLAAMLIKQINQRSKKTKQIDGIASLNVREEDILGRVAEGWTNKEIARQLNLSEKTIKHYMTSIMQKLHVRNRLQAAAMLRDHGDHPPR